MLDKEYSNIKFGNLDNYISYINAMNYSTYSITGYYKKSFDDYIIYGVYDSNGNFFGFKANGVMQYVVYLDEDTIEIW